MPNGQLQQVYGSNVIAAGKIKNEQDRAQNRLSSARFRFSKVQMFKLLQTKYRIKVVYLHPDIINNNKFNSELEHFISLYHKQRD